MKYKNRLPIYTSKLNDKRDLLLYIPPAYHVYFNSLNDRLMVIQLKSYKENRQHTAAKERLFSCMSNIMVKNNNLQISTFIA